MPAETEVRHQKKKDARQDSPQSTLRISGHQLMVSGIVGVKPQQDDHSGERHGRDEARKRREPPSDLRGQEDNGHTDAQLYERQYAQDDCPRLAVMLLGPLPLRRRWRSPVIRPSSSGRASPGASVLRPFQ